MTIASQQSCRLARVRWRQFGYYDSSRNERVSRGGLSTASHWNYPFPHNNNKPSLHLLTNTIIQQCANRI
eukprot:scaffold4799_cov65-Cylindrotheca_fusiformis.AAC.1